MNHIAAEDRRGGIGFRGALLAHLPSDMKFFRTTTTGGTVILGRKTLESFPGGRPLPKRRNIVLSRTLSPEPDAGYEVCRSPEEVLSLVSDQEPDRLFVIGGEQIYRRFLPYCEEALITELEGEWEADAFLPVFSQLPDWQEVSRSEPLTENGVTYSFVTYRRCQR